jgi:Protein kinase domain
MLEAGTIVAERFRLVRQLGMGGMGAVWLAQHTQLDVPCAIKFIHAHAATSVEIRGRFEREAKAAAALRSPNVVGILDHGIWNETPYIAMEYLEGEDLDGRLARKGRLTPQELVPIISQVARALSKAHAAGLIHRDIKPANIFLTRDDDQEIAKVLDFGIAKSNLAGLSDSATKTGSVLGTPYYMSPEQAQGTRTVDHRSDLWALAIVVFQCLTGQLPFRSEAFGDLLMKIMMDPIPQPSLLAPLPPGFDLWWARAATRDPAGRFQSAREFAEALGLSLGVTLGTAASAQRDPWTFDPAVHGGQSSWAPQLAQSSPHADRASHPQFAMVGPHGPVAGMQTGGGPTQNTLAVTGNPAPSKGGKGVAVAAMLATLGAIGVAVFFFTRGSPAGSEAAAAAASSAPAAAAKSAEALPSAAPVASAEPAPAASASASAAASASAEPEPPATATAQAAAPVAAPNVPVRPTPPRAPAAKPPPAPSAKPAAKPAGMNYGI